MKFLYTLIISFFFILFFSYFAHSQITISGWTVDKNREPISASIAEMNTMNGILSDSSGKFTLTVNNNSIIEIGSVGFEFQRIPVSNFIQNDTIVLEEYVMDKYYGIKRFNPKAIMVGYSYNNLSLPLNISLGYFAEYGRLRLAEIQIKSNIHSENDIKISIQNSYKKIRILSKISSAFIFQQRNINNHNANIQILDYQFLLSREFFSNNKYVKSRVWIGTNYKRVNSLNTNMAGVVAGIEKYIPKTQSHIKATYIKYWNYYENSICLFQNISKHNKFLRYTAIGFEYKTYENYNEFNALLRYTFYLHSN